MILHSGERGIYAENVDATVQGENHNGILYLTNLRLVFEATFGGSLLNPGVPRTLLDLGLEQVSNIAAVASGFGRPRLQIEAARGAYFYTFKTPNAAGLVQSISEAR